MVELAATDLATCRALLRGGSRSFHAASRLLPHRLRVAATSLYAFCRVADDAIDLARSADERAANLQELRLRLHAAARGAPCDHAVDRALAWVMAAHGIRVELLDHLLEGLGWDAARRRYGDFAALHAYAERVAGTVGMMMAAIMGVRDGAMLARAADLGIAMQLTNIARAVGEDARAARIYLPLAWLREAGIDPDAWLAAPCHGPALAAVIARLLREADALYRRADPAIAVLPADCRRAIRAARLLYAAIGDAVASAGCDAVTRRAVVPRWRKAALVASALRGEPSLLDRTGARLLWAIELFQRLEQRDLLGRVPP
jgi:15-cis-phytoene synthase